MEEMISAADSFEPINELKLLETEPIGTAEEHFTRLETSIYIADVMQQLTGADIALVPNNYFYRSNIAEIYKGDIVYPERFIQQGTGTKDYLTTYEISGAALRELMEHPIINGEEINAMYAFSGLVMEYAPWRDQNENVIKLTLADGSEIEDTKRYTVAAWATSIDESYIASALAVHSELGKNIDLVTSAVKQEETISPAKDGRLTLVWDRD